MRLGLRLLFGFFVVTAIAALLLLRVFLAEVKPSVREVMEDLLVDVAHALAEQAAADLRAMAPGDTLEGTRFAAAVATYRSRPVDAEIWGLRKRTLDLRVSVTDAAGRVVYASPDGAATVGADHSRWNDVARTLRGEYGARSTRDAGGDDRSAVLYVAAPVRGAEGRTIGVLTVAKPVAAVQQFIDRAERKIAVAGAVLLVSCLGIGVAVTAWIVHSVRKLRRYAQQARAGERRAVPALPGELGDLARAMGAMRERLEGRAQVEQAMRALTHELKSPLTAIGGAAELLAEPLPAADRERFAAQIGEQTERLRAIVDRLLELSKLESLQAPEHARPLSLPAEVKRQLGALAAPLAQRRIAITWGRADETPIAADAERLGLALSNLLANAVDFAPDGSTIEVDVARERHAIVLTLRDQGPGVPDRALPQLGERFFSMPKPRSGVRGSGLGLAIVRQVVALHGGTLSFENANPGLRVRLALPPA